MKGKTAFNAMEGIDPRYILEAAPDAAAPIVVGRRTKFLRLAAVAAALAVVVAVGAVVAPMLMKEPATPAEPSRFSLQRVYKSHYAEEAWGPEGAVNMYVQTVDWAEHPEGQVFVLGDNRENSMDSRDFGCVNVADITGRVLLHAGQIF